MRKTIKLALIVAIMFTVQSCTDVEGTRKTLKRNCYKPIEVGGYRFFGSNETFKTSFKAIAPNGETVTGYVTKDFFKGNAIRLDD